MAAALTRPGGPLAPPEPPPPPPPPIAPGPPPPFNRYVMLSPSSSHTWQQLAWNALSIAILVIYVVIAVAAVVFTGLYLPGYLPVTMVTAYSFTPLAYNSYEYCSQLAVQEKLLATVEEGVVRELSRLVNMDVNMRDELRSLHIDPTLIIGRTHFQERWSILRPLIARYKYWLTRSQLQHHEAQQVLGRIPVDNPALRRTGYQKAFELRVEAQIAKVYAAYFRGILINPYCPFDMQDTVHLHLPPVEYSLMTYGLNVISPGARLDETLFTPRLRAVDKWTLPQLEKADVQDICTALFTR